MYRPRPLRKKLECHVCGKPAKWYDREFHSTYVLGEALCDDCNSKFTQYCTNSEYQGGISDTKGNFVHGPDATTLRLNERIMPPGGIRQTQLDMV